MTVKRILLATSVAVTILASTTAISGEKNKTPGSGPNPFSDCGIGAALFTNTKWAAVTSNVIWDIGITAITSATASPETCSGKNVTAALFIRDTYASLTEETAAGEGEHLTTVLNIFGCDVPYRANTVKQIRTEMGQLISSPGYVDQPQLNKDAAFYSVIKHAVDSSCSV